MVVASRHHGDHLERHFAASGSSEMAMSTTPFGTWTVWYLDAYSA